jgi:hypothetical protein
VPDDFFRLYGAAVIYLLDLWSTADPAALDRLGASPETVRFAWAIEAARQAMNPPPVNPRDVDPRD